MRQAGIRIGKWEYEIGGTPDMSNDVAVFRYADVLLMKAEALWRKSNSPTDAVALSLVNQIRARAGIPDIASLDGPLSFDISAGSIPGGELLNERGREFFAEQSRRQDLIRWRYYTLKDETKNRLKWGLPTRVAGDVWNFESYTEIFPIPLIQLEAGSNLQQNPGY